jgi:hypothetical protein
VFLEPRPFSQLNKQDEAGALLRLRAAQQAGVLGLSRSRLASIPEAIASLAPVVRVVDVSHNQLRAVPPVLSLLQRLVAANLSDNRLTSLPAGFALPQLAVLDLSCNCLRELPEDFGAGLPALRQLYLAGNGLWSLPAALKNVGVCWWWRSGVRECVRLAALA